MNLPGSTKQEIYGLVARCTEDFCQTQALVCDSAYISGSLNISRSLASQYLNEFVRDQELIKINTRLFPQPQDCGGELQGQSDGQFLLRSGGVNGAGGEVVADPQKLYPGYWKRHLS